MLSSSIWPFLNQGCERNLLSLTKLLNHTKSLLCTDPRDRLYAIHSVLRPRYGKIIIHDYSLNVDDVYLNFTKEWLLKLRSTKFLSFCDLRHDPEDHGIIRPSWVPDFGNISNNKRIHIYFRCSGKSFAFVTPNNHDRHITVQGVLMGTLTFVTEPTTLTLSSTEREVRELYLLWKRIILMDGFILSKEVSSFNDWFSETIINGLLAEKLPSVVTNYWTKLESVKSFLVDMNNVDDQFTLDLLRGGISRAICDRLLFKTAERSFGIGPLNALPGDRVAIILGCHELLILRPDETNGNNHFRVVGPCYISGLADGEGLLGPIPFGWCVRREAIRDEKQVSIFTNGNIQTQQDPRIPLPPAWRYRYGDKETPQEVEAEALEDMALQWFENIETREKSWRDPRLTPELLRERGVAVEELTLI